ncbi:MAG: hypothetical protein COA78_15800 [Blastopirellula sp.]|nr:MAG: hypothetical protein COA78_15800 [Blastopirellula sp.]
MDLAVAPDILIRALSSPDWPSKPIWGSKLRHLHPMFDRFNIELLQTLEQLIHNTLANFAQRPDNRDHLKLTIGSQFGESVLPVLDVEQAVVFGGGAAIGDDFWLAVDLRSDAQDPSVIGNHFGQHGCNWVQVAPSFTAFCQELSISIPE